MKFLDPAIRLVGSLSFRNKLKLTALMFGIPLLITLGIILAGVTARVNTVQAERAALALQVPALTLQASLHRYFAAAQALREGADELAELTETRRQSADAALRRLEWVFAGNAAATSAMAGQMDWADTLADQLRQAESADAAGVADLHATMSAAVRGQLDRINEAAGLLVDGEASSSRLIGVLTSFVPELIDTTGKSARLGASILVRKSLKSSRRTELTLLRGKFDSLVEWSMLGLHKAAQAHPVSAARLEEAASVLNTAYLGVQEAMTTKMLDTIDYDMAPSVYLDLASKALEESLRVADAAFAESELLLRDRERLLQAQLYAVATSIVIVLALVVAGFVSAYISIMRGLNSLSQAVNTMAAGDLDARVEISTRDEIGMVGTQFNRMVENLAQRTAQLREKTNDIQNMLHHMPQGILTIVECGAIHSEYSDYLETIFETREVRGRRAIDFIFGGDDVGTDALAQVGAAVSACIGEDRMNFEFNAHLFVEAFAKTMPDGRVKFLELSWSPICGESDTVEKIMVCVRDVTELRRLEAEAEVQKRELQMIGQILAVTQERFHEFVANARGFLAENEELLRAAETKDAEILNRLFRNMHTVKGNARTYGLLHLTHAVHEAEQAYDELRRDPSAAWSTDTLLAQLDEVRQRLEEYATLNEMKLGRKGPGRRASTEKYVMVQRTVLDRLLQEFSAEPSERLARDALTERLGRVERELRRIGTTPVESLLDTVFESMRALAGELGKEAPKLEIEDRGIVVRNQIADLLRNVFMHLYRNAVDHGLEGVVERVAKGKPAAGTIRLDLDCADDTLTLRLEDDGRGLALAHLRKKAVEKGWVDAAAELGDDEVARLIFAPGFSTASTVTEVSGRGVGMDAVRDFVQREGGDIRLEFTDHRRGADYRRFATLITLPGKYALVDPARGTAGLGQTPGGLSQRPALLVTENG